MNRFQAKHFNKNKAVKAIIFSKDKRIKTFYANPESNIIKLGNKSYTINDDDWFISDGFPTFVYNDQSAEPQNPIKAKLKPVMSPEDFNVAISAKVAKEIFDASNGKLDSGSISMILSFLTLIGIGALYYVFNEKFTAIMSALDEIRQVLRIISGV
jgi:hypothetical protein